MRQNLVFLLLLAPIGFLTADTRQVVLQADALHGQGKFAEAKSLLLGSVTGAATGKEKAELYWRLSRETLELGGIAEEAGRPASEVLKICEEGDGFANAAIESDPQNDLGYYWKSANIGRWGQVKGVMNALFKTGPIRDLLVKVLDLNPERSDAYYVLGQLYRELPGWPVSFGNTDAAVSLSRRAVDLRMSQYRAGREETLDFDFYTELAKTLYKRNWTAAARVKMQEGKKAKYGESRTPLERDCLYEAVVGLEDMSDREEAAALLLWSIEEMEKLPRLTQAEAQAQRTAKVMLKSLAAERAARRSPSRSRGRPSCPRGFRPCPPSA